MPDGIISLSAVATALWAVFSAMKTSAEANRPRAGGYNIYLTRSSYLSFANLLSEFQAGRKRVLAGMERCNFLANHLRYET